MRKEAGHKDPTHPRPFMIVEEENLDKASSATVSISEFHWHETRQLSHSQATNILS
jgi:hypothetical protein